MYAALKFLLWIFVYCSLGYGGGMGFLAFAATLATEGQKANGTLTALLIGLLVLVFAGGAFGFFMSFFLGGWHILAVRRRGFPLTEGTLSLHQDRTLTLDLPYQDSFDLCLQAVRALERSRLKDETDSETGEILAATAASWHAGAGEIRIRLRDLGNQTAVAIECRPPHRLALADFGGNLRNADGLVTFLLAHAPDWARSRKAAPEGVRLPQGGVKGSGEVRTEN
jgi:hypothetical protein